MDNTTVDELWRAKYLYDSAYHPDTGEKVMVLGRMSACAPVNMILSGAMLTFRKTLVVSYACATTTAVGTALEINKLATTSILERLVPFAAIVVANAINIPIIRSQELIRGTEVFCQDGRYVGKSRIAGLLGIFFVYICRIAMIAPAMILPTFFCDLLDKQGILSLYPRAELPLQAFLQASSSYFRTPCAAPYFFRNHPLLCVAWSATSRILSRR
ncbi:sideroflexin-1-like isoform X2 [Periplaneta americana]|uniref:sideroflexin-1-like isoform X2 n=1 Tax=Periplaneta americana TaxID=6978 RepID=UPI0037E73BCA